MIIFSINIKQIILTLILDLLLKKNVIGSGLLESDPQITRDDHVDQVNLLEIDTIFVEADVMVSLQCGGQLTLDISDLTHLYLFDVVSDCFLALMGQQFLQLVCSQLVQEQLAVGLSRSSLQMRNVTPMSSDTFTLSLVGHPSIYNC